MSEQDASQWFIARDGKQTGPIADIEIKTIAAHGYFRATDLVWRAGFAEWRPAFSVFAPKPAVAAPPAPPPLPPADSRPADTNSPSPSTNHGDSRTSSGRAMASPGAPAAKAHDAALRQAPESITQRMAREPQTQATRLPTQPPYRTDAPTAGPPVGPGNALTASAASALPPRDLTSIRNASPQASEPPEPLLAAAPRKTPVAAIAALVLTVGTIAAGVWIAANPGAIKGLPVLSAATNRGTQPAEDGNVATSDLEQRWQQTAFWPVIKREFPDWYGERLREATALASAQKSDGEINKVLVGQLINLRRQNAAQALAASTPKLKALAAAFLENLQQLKAQSTTTCFNFISQGEITPGVVEQMQASGGQPSSMQLQVAAIFDAIADGRKTPVAHEKPQKADYDALMEQLSKLGWTQADVATFADPNALARAEPARVCQMVQDWFVAHIAIPDAATQERLLGETLRPVVSG